MIMELHIADVSISNQNGQMLSLHKMLRGSKMIVLLFFPFLFGDALVDSMDRLVLELSHSMKLLYDENIRVVCITR